MPEMNRDGKLLTGAAAALAGGGIAAGVRSNRLSTIASEQQVMSTTRTGLAQQEQRLTPRQLARQQQRTIKVGDSNSSVTPVRGLKENARTAELRSLREDMQKRYAQADPRQEATFGKPDPEGDAAKKKAWANRQLDQNPDEFRKQIKARRLADRAARASKMAKGLTKKMGVLGATVGMADTYGTASRVDKEGGSFEARFGKFAEEWLGIRPGSTQRPLTEKEKEAHWST